MSRFNATKGEFWIAPLPDGQFAILWRHPNLGEWHRQIAAFPSKERAESYVLNETQALSEAFAAPDLVEPVPEKAEEEFVQLTCANPEMHKLIADAMSKMGATEENGKLTMPPKSAHQQVEDVHTRLVQRLAPKTTVVPRPLINRDQLLADLGEWFKIKPEGITGSDFIERYHATYNDSLMAMRWLDENGYGKWVYRDGRHGGIKVLLPPEAPYVEMDLTVKQEKVLMALAAKKSQDGTVAMSMADIEKLSGVSRSGMGAHLWTLERKAYIRLIQKAPLGGMRPALYKILRTKPETIET